MEYSFWMDRRKKKRMVKSRGSAHGVRFDGRRNFITNNQTNKLRNNKILKKYDLNTFQHI